MKRLLSQMIAATAFGALLAGAQPIRIRGSDTLGARAMPQLVERYKVSNREVRFEISAEGSTQGFKAFLDGRTDIGMSSREMTAEEEKQFTDRGIVLSRWQVATDPFVIVVNADNPVAQLTARQVESIFTGDVKDWSEVGGRPGQINLHLRNSASSSYGDFRRIALGGRAYGKTKFSLSGADLPSLAVAKDGGGITWIALAYTKTTGIRVLKIDGHPQVGEGAASYPYLRKLWCFTSQPSGTPAHDFLKWITTSAEAADVLRKTGYLVPDRKTD
ncbi:MAG: phosphate-binding protein [Verrucomicrobiaceae bacterium]|nr:MAG: phosphate-binding protein [Verrucomicrobiaceae bacterium]